VNVTEHDLRRQVHVRNPAQTRNAEHQCHGSIIADTDRMSTGWGQHRVNP
jgi:hypothetical protein